MKTMINWINMTDLDGGRMGNKNKTFTITKKISKHGNQAIIVIPKLLEEVLRPGTVAEIRIEILEQLLKNSPPPAPLQ